MLLSSTSIKCVCCSAMHVMQFWLRPRTTLMRHDRNWSSKLEKKQKVSVAQGTQYCTHTQRPWRMVHKSQQLCLPICLLSDAAVLIIGKQFVVKIPFDPMKDLRAVFFTHYLLPLCGVLCLDKQISFSDQSMAHFEWLLCWRVPMINGSNSIFIFLCSTPVTEHAGKRQIARFHFSCSLAMQRRLP